MNVDIPLNRVDAYEVALDYLYSFIDFERRQQDRYMASKLDATRPQRFLDALGSPYMRYPALHVAGTKGKGSVAAMCAACLRAAGYRVGLYTSPHLIDFRERIRVLTPEEEDGRISQNQFVTLVDQIKEAVTQFPDVTWFEILTALAFLHFARQQVDVAVVEVGLGGRLDATNVITPLVSVITSLSLDHTKFLGNTLDQIAYEKGGIIKPGIPVVTAWQKPEALHRLLHIAAERQSPISIIGEHWQYAGGEVDVKRGEQTLLLLESADAVFVQPQSAFRLALSGGHQLENAAVAIAALSAVRPHLPALNETAVRRGLATVQWPGRLQIIHHGDQNTPTLLVDCAHNPDSAARLRHALTHDYPHNRLWFILGAPADKDISGIMAQLLPIAAGVIVTTANHPRSVPPSELAQMSAALGYEAIPAADMSTAVRQAWQRTAPDDLICVTGSIIVVGDLLNQWESLQSELISDCAIE